MGRSGGGNPPFPGWLIDRRRLGGGYMSPEMLILIALSALNLLLLILVAYLGGRSIEIAIEELDGRLAEAIQSLINEITQGGLEGFEPPNPIQIAISQLIAGWADQQKQIIPANVTTRDDKGQFKTDKID